MQNVLILFAFILTSFQALASELGHGLCNINGVPVGFNRVASQGSQFIISGIVQIERDAYLSYHYNPFYDIGGSVSLKTNSGRSVLLSWDNGFSDPISQGSVRYQRHLIECRLP